MVSQDRILLVDDDLDLVMFLKLCLQCSFHVIPTIDATAALILLQKRTFDIVISDYVMPGMNGIELLERVCEVQPLAVRVLFSGARVDKAIEDAQKSGLVDLFLSKPLNIVGLDNLLKKLLEKSLGSSLSPEIPPTAYPA